MLKRISFQPYNNRGRYSHFAYPHSTLATLYPLETLHEARVGIISGGDFITAQCVPPHHSAVRRASMAEAQTAETVAPWIVSNVGDTTPWKAHWTLNALVERTALER